MSKTKQDKLIPVFILCPNDCEKPVMYFSDRQSALDFAKSYRNGAHVSANAEMVPERIVRNKSIHIAKKGHVL